MKKTLAMIEFKCWYYEQAMKDGSEDGINKMIPDKLPEKIQELYDFAHNRNTEQEKDCVEERIRVEDGTERLAYEKY